MAACISRGPRTTSAQQQSNADCTQQQNQQQSQQYNQIIKIYTEWGNHYLEKARFKKMIQNIQLDLTDGVLLADLIEAVCGQKVADVNRKPRTHVVMLENIRNCLVLLGRLGVSLDGITAKDVRDGNLKVILGLFFSLSKFKQQQKQKLSSSACSTSSSSAILMPSSSPASTVSNYGSCRLMDQHSATVSGNNGIVKPKRHLQQQHHYQLQQQQPQQQKHLMVQNSLLNEDMKQQQSRLPSPYYNQHTNTIGSHNSASISSGPQRSSRAPLPGLNSVKNSLSANSSRSVSPSHSFIPTPRHSANHTRSSLNEKQLISIKNSGNNLRSSNNSINTSHHTPPPSTRNSMLDKIKVIGSSKDRSKQGIGNAVNIKRPSSSSGISSTRSERSDSSSSLCNEGKHVSSINKKDNTGGTEVFVKPLLRKKIVVKPTEQKSIKTPIRNATVSNKLDSHKPLAQTTSLLNNTSSINDHITVSSSTICSIASTNSVAVTPLNTVPTSVSTTIINCPATASFSSSSSSPITIINSTSSTPQNLPVSCTEDSLKNMDLKGNNSGIPKPTAAVKGTAKPTNSVAPMLISDKIDKNDHISIMMPIEDKPSLTVVDKKIEEIKEEIQQEDKQVSHQKQGSIGEDDELSSMMNIKPMEPLLRGYKRSIVLPHRTTLPSSSFSVGGRQQLPNGNNSYSNQIYAKYASRFDFKKNSADDDNYSSVTSGYLSDGDVLQASTYSNKLYTDLDGGYMSEGGAHMYDYCYEMRLKKNEAANNNILSKHRYNSNAQSGEKSTDVLSALLVNSPVHKLHNQVSNVRGHGPEDGPVSPPEPTPTHPVGYCSGTLSSSSRTSSVAHSPVVYRVVGSRSHVKKSDNSQQTDNTSFKQIQNDNSVQWKRNNTEIDGRGSGSNPDQIRTQTRDKQVIHNGATNSNASTSRKIEKRRTSSTSSSREELTEMDYYNGERKCRGDSKTKVRGVPSSFGYVKKTTNNNAKESRTAQVSAVPRTKVKVSGGTQTDLKTSSLNNATSAQLSQGIRDRLMIASADIASKSSRAQCSNRPNVDAGSLSDSTYSDAQASSNPYSSWFRHGSPYTASLPARTNIVPGTLAEADSIESLPAQLHQHRSSLTYSRIMSGSVASPPPSSSRLSRSNSIRSTKSEKLYPSMFQRTDELEPLYSIPYNGLTTRRISQGEPPSPTSSHLSQGTTATNTSSRYNYMTSPSSNHSYNRNSPYMNYLTKMNSKEEDVRGSAVSLLSTGSSSLFSTPEEKQAQEVRRLQKDLSEAREKVQTLEGQLSTNAHVVSAFEKSLSNMTHCLEKKDSEMMKLRQTIEMLKKQAGNSNESPANNSYSPSLARRHTINSTLDSSQSNNIARQLSTDSVSSLASLSSACSLSSSGNHQTDSSSFDKHKKKRGWLRSSFSKAFSRSKKNRNGSVSDIEDARAAHSDMSAPSSPLLNSPHQMNGDLDDSSTVQHMKNSHSSSALYNNSSHTVDNDSGRNKLLEYVQELEKQLREKDLVLTDARLEALSSAHQLQSVKDAMIKMRNELMNLQQDNERLQKIAGTKSLGSSQNSLQTHDGMDRRFSTTDIPINMTNVMKDEDIVDPNAKRISVSVYLGSHGNYNKYVEEKNICRISNISVHSTTNWQTLDTLICRALKEYLDRIDAEANLGIGTESIWSYHIGEVIRYKDSDEPELLPCGYLVGENADNITVCLKGGLHNGCLDALTFETLTPKSIILRYVNLLTEHRRIMLCGPSGTGKSYLANKLAEYLVYRSGKDTVNSESIVTFNVDEKSLKDLRQYFSNMAELCENNETSKLPVVFILDNLHHAPSLNEIFNGLLNTKLSKACPYIIGTMNQATCSTTNLQLHHNFRWILCANHMEPVKGLLSRYLTRKLIDTECKSNNKNPELTRIIEWVPKVQQYLNKFLETHNSSEVTIGPKLFMLCPMEVDGSRVWFTDLWNYSIVPYLLDAIRDGLQLYGKRTCWQDPSQFIIQNYPWNKSAAVHSGIDTLVRLRPEDVGYEPQNEPDPLLNMLMTLREAVNYNESTQDNDSDSAGPTSNVDLANNNSSNVKLVSHEYRPI